MLARCPTWGAQGTGTTCPVGPHTGSRALTKRPKSIGLKPLMSGLRTEDEGLFVVQHKYWQEALQRALAAEVTPEA